MKFRIILIASTIGWMGCASSRMSNREIDRLFQNENYNEAILKLKEGLEKEKNGDDQLLYQLDLALALHQAGEYEESNKYFLLAEETAEIKDYTSLADESATLLTSDNIKAYKGEDFEKILINTYLAVNFTLLNNKDSAHVEARKVNRKLNRMITEGKRKYKQSAFARYLSAILFEESKDYDDAYIDYKKTYELDPHFLPIGVDLWRLAHLAGRTEDLDQWEKIFGQEIRQGGVKQKRNELGELIVIYENGIGPIKRPNPQMTSLPKFYPRRNPVQYAMIQVNNQSFPTHKLEDIESIAINNLEEKYGALIAKKIAGVVAKEVVANQVGKATDSPLLGFFTKILFYASDTADIRSWSLLPKDLQVARIALKPGVYDVEIIPVGSNKTIHKTVEIRASKFTYLNTRFMP